MGVQLRVNRDEQEELGGNKKKIRKKLQQINN